MSEREGAYYRPLVWSVSLALVASGVLLSIQMISSVVGPFRLSELGAHDPRGVVALWQPAGSAAGAAVRSALGHELVESGRAVREVLAFDALEPARVGAIVLSEPRTLDAKQISALESYLDAGGGVVLLGSVAVLDRDGGWLGHATMERLLGAPLVVLDTADALAFVAARRGPLSAPLAPRERIDVAAEVGTLGVVASDPELRWVTSRPDASIAAGLRRSHGAGRLVWLAVPPERAAPSESEKRRARSLLQAAVAWASRTPWVEVLPWPNGKPFASWVETGAFEGALEAEWPRAIAAAKRDAGPAALRMPADVAAQNALQPALARTLGALGRDDAWVTTRLGYAQWTRRRAVIDASVRRVGPRRLSVEVTNPTRNELDGVVLRVHLNDPAVDARAEATQLLQKAAQTRLSPDGNSFDLAVPRIEARSSAAYTVDVEPMPGRAEWESSG